VGWDEKGKSWFSEKVNRRAEKEKLFILDNDFFALLDNSQHFIMNILQHTNHNFMKKKHEKSV
jgi:hypothetical protein